MGRQSLRERSKRRAAVSPSQVVATRLAAIEVMNGKLKRQFQRIETSINDLRADNLRYYWQLGQLHEEVRNKPDEYRGTNGESGLKLLEAALSTQARTLRKAATFAREYNEPQLEQLINWYHADSDFQLHWGHVGYLLTLPTHQERNDMAKAAVQNMWDPATLHDQIRKKHHRRGSGHGRTHSVPASVPAQVRQMVSVSKAWLGKQRNVWNGERTNVFANILNMPPDTMDADLLENLRSVQQMMTDIAGEAGENVARVARAVEFVHGRIEAQAAAAAAAPAEEAAPAKATGTSRRRREPRHIDLDSSGTSANGRAHKAAKKARAKARA